MPNFSRLTPVLFTVVALLVNVTACCRDHAPPPPVEGLSQVVGESLRTYLDVRVTTANWPTRDWSAAGTPDLRAAFEAITDSFGSALSLDKVLTTIHGSRAYRDTDSATRDGKVEEEIRKCLADYEAVQEGDDNGN